MTVISISITESTDQIISGIPRSIVLSTNIPSTIFYTLSGIDPNDFSNIYTSAIQMPTDKLTIVLKVLATNGVDSSPIITEIYQTDTLDNSRLPHSPTTGNPQHRTQDLYPFGGNSPNPNGVYLNPAYAGVTVDNPDLMQIPNGFNDQMLPDGYTNKTYNFQNYDIVYSDSDFEGKRGPGIGNLPAKVNSKPQIPVPEISDEFDPFFDPRAMVVFQDFTKEDPNDPAIINGMYVSLQNPERSRDGNDFLNVGNEVQPPGGAFVRQFFNPRDNTMTSYYFDSRNSRWLIAKSPYMPSGPYDGNLSRMFQARGGVIGQIFEWQTAARRYLF